VTSLLLVTWATSNICDFSPPTFFEFIPPNTRVGRDQSERSTSYVPGMNGSFLHSATWTLSEGAISSCEREIRVATSVTFDANLDHIAGDEHAGQSVRVYRRNEFSVTSHTILASSTPFWNETLHDHVLWICDARRDDKRPSSIITVAVAPSWATWMLDWVFGHIGRAACLFFFSCAVHCRFVCCGVWIPTVILVERSRRLGWIGSSGVSKAVGIVETPGPRECAHDCKPWALRTH